MGIFLLEMGIQDDCLGEWSYYLLDISTGVRFGHSSIGKSTAAAALSALSSQEQLYLIAKQLAA